MIKKCQNIHDKKYFTLLHWRWILRTLVKKIDETAFILVPHLEEFQDEDEIQSHALDYLKDAMKDVSSFLPETFKVDVKLLKDQILQDLGMFLFVSDKFQEAKDYFEQMDGKKEIQTFLKVCNSILSKHDDDQEMVTAILNEKRGENDGIVMDLLNLLLRDCLEPKISVISRKNILASLLHLETVAMKIRALNFVRELFHGPESRDHLMFCHNVTFLKNVAESLEKCFQINSKMPITPIIRVIELIESTRNTDLFDFVKSQCKMVSSNWKQHGESVASSVVAKEIAKRPLENIEMPCLKKFKLDVYENFEFVVENAKRLYYRAQFKESQGLFDHILTNAPKKDLTSEYWTLLINLQDPNKFFDTQSSLFTLLDQKKFPSLEIRSEIFKIFVDQSQWQYMKKYFEILPSDTFNKFALEFAQLNERDSTDLEQFFRFIKILKEDETSEFYQYIVTTRNHSALIRFTCLMSYTLFSVRMGNKMENPSYYHFRELASFYFADDFLIAPSPNPLWMEKSSEEILINVLRICLENICNVSQLPTSRMFVKEPKMIQFCACLADILYESGEIERSILVLTPHLDMTNFDEPIIRRLIASLIKLRNYSCAAVLQQFLPVYDSNIISYIKKVDKFWLPDFFNISYLEILMYHCNNDRDRLSKLIERLELVPTSKEYKDIVSTKKLTVIKKMKSMFK